MSQVIINDVPPYTQGIASSGQTNFGTNWTANAASDVVVFYTPQGSAPDDFTQILAYPSQYTVSFVGFLQQVEVTLVTPAVLGDKVTITRMTPADRENLYSNTNFTASMLNNDFGILTLVDQQAQLVNQQIAPRYNYSATIQLNIDNILPLLGPSQVWMKNASNTAIEAVDFSGGGGGGGSVTLVSTGLGLTGGPITTTGTISFAAIGANTFWGNISGVSALPAQVPTSYFLISSNNLSDVPNKATARTNLGLVIGVNVEAWSPALDSIAALTTVANEIPYLTGVNTYGVIGAAANSVLVTSAGSVPSLSTTLPSAVQLNITELGAQSQALNMNSHKITNVTDPTNPQDAATMAYVTSQTIGMFLPLSGGTMTGQIDMGNHKIINITDPSSSKDAVNLEYLVAQLANYLNLSGGTMTGNINMGSNLITNLANPVNSTDAANKFYVDSIASGLTVQPACYAATTANLTATYVNGASGIGATLTNSGALAQFTTDGQTPPTNARILVWQQSSTLQNGIYTLTNQGSGAVAWILTRATDYDQPAEIQPGDLVIINNGTTYGGTSFIETASVATIGTDPILFSQFTFSASSVLLKANNLSDVANTTTAFNNISPLTTKGDLIGFSTQNIRVAVGSTNAQILQVNSAATAGISWSTATYPVTTTANQILYSSATNTVGGLTSIAGGVLVTDASSVPSFLANPGAAGKVLQSANAAIPTWSTPTYPSASGTSGKLLISDGTNNVYSTSTFPTSAGSTAGKIIVSDGTNYVLSTPTFPNASATSRKIIVSDGTNWVASTETYATPGTSGNVMTSNGTNWVSSAPSGSGTVNTGLINQLAYYAAGGTAVSGLATANSAMLTTDSGGVPTWSGTMTNGQLIIGNTGGTPTAATLTAGTGITITNAAHSITIAATGAALNGINQVVKQVFTSSGTYTPTSGMKYCIIECVGSGGGGGGCVNSISNQALGGGGGGAGSYSRLYATSATIGSSQTVTINSGGTAGANTGGNGGNGGDVSVGTLCIGKGGSGGTGIGSAPNGGAGGVAGTGDFTAVGNGGGSGIVLAGSGTYGFCGQGAASIFGGQPAQAVATGATATNGANGGNYGAGANGGLTISAGGAVTGGVGAKGVVVITEYLSV